MPGCCDRRWLDDGISCLGRPHASPCGFSNPNAGATEPSADLHIAVNGRCSCESSVRIVDPTVHSPSDLTGSVCRRLAQAVLLFQILSGYFHLKSLRLLLDVPGNFCGKRECDVSLSPARMSRLLDLPLMTLHNVSNRTFLCMSSKVAGLRSLRIMSMSSRFDRCIRSR